MQLLKNDDYSAALERLAERSTTLEINELLTHQDLMDLTGFPRQRTSALVARVNQDLLCSKRFLVNVRGVGYRLASTLDQLEHADQRRERSRRQVIHGSREVEGIDLSRLSADAHPYYQQLRSQLQYLAQAARKNSQLGIDATKRALAHQEHTLSQIQRLLDLLK